MMNIGIIVHSKSGHTFNIARKIAAKCDAEKIKNEIILLKFEGKIAPRSKDIKIIEPPKIDMYDTIVFGAPVWAFTASPIITAYLKQLQKCEGKKMLCFVTMGFPFAFMGGNQAISAMNKLLSKYNGKLLPGEVIPNSSGISDAKANAIAERIVQRIK